MSGHLGKWPNGDAGDALDYALDHIDDPFERLDFLECWRSDDIGEWPAYFAWLNLQYPASVGRNAERQDHEDGLGPKDEHAVGSVADETPDV